MINSFSTPEDVVNAFEKYVSQYDCTLVLSVCFTESIEGLSKCVNCTGKYFENKYILFVFIYLILILYTET